MSTEANTHPAAAELAERLAKLEQDLYALRDSVRAAAGEKLREISGSAAGCCQEQAEKVWAAEQCVKDKILEQPVKSLAIALGAGFVLGAFWARR